VRGLGIDTVALDHVAARHDTSKVMFVDGWTGKGAIVKELQAALLAYGVAGGAAFPDDLAVIADPGAAALHFGTREDILIPSACLNSTVCGLVSRTVYSRELIAPGTFHGAKVYRELAPEDRSAQFLDAVSGQFPAVAPEVGARSPSANRAVTFRGLEELLRRLPWQVLVHPDREEQLAHLFLLAEERGVPVVRRSDMSYSAVGLVRPLEGAGR